MGQKPFILTMIQNTSLLAYEEAKKNLGEKQRIVYNVIKVLEGATDKQISERLGWPINCVTNRRGELVELKLIGFDKYVLNKSNRKVMSWKAVK